MAKNLYKTTIVIWSDTDTSNEEIDSIANGAMHSDYYCSRQVVELVAEPEKDKDWDGTEFFEDGKIEKVDENTSVGEFSKPQVICPYCKSDNITNEDAPVDGTLLCDCLDCGRKWTEPLS